MLKNYIKIAYRNLVRNKLYSVIIIAGLAIGLAGFSMITNFVGYELSYDNFHGNAKDIYRLSIKYDFNGEFQNIAMSPPSFAPLMKDEFSEIADYCRFMPVAPVVISYGETKINQNAQFADGSVFSIFEFKLVYGNKESILKEKFRVMLSESTAKKYFGEANPVGKVLNYSDAFDLIVDGVFEDIPLNSHIRFDFLVSFVTLEDESVFGKENLNSKTSCNFYTYLFLKQNADYKLLEAKFDEFSQKHLDEQTRAKLSPFLEKLSDIYLYSDTIYGTGIQGNIQYIYIFLAIAFFIVILAAINFMNLSSSRALYRIKEVGIRKVTGGGKKDLIFQFLGESVLTTIFSFLFSIVLVELLSPFFNSMIDKTIEFSGYAGLQIVAVNFSIALLVGLTAGVYPALYMSSFNISDILKGSSIKSKGAGLFRKGMVVFQFTVSVVLIVGSVVVYSQLNFMRNKDLGFTKENVVYFTLNTPRAQAQSDLIREELKRDPQIINATVSNRVLGGVGGGWYLDDEEGKRYEATVVFVDEDFLNTFGLKLKEGRAFSKEIPTDKENAFLITESTAKLYGWNDPLQKRFNLSGIQDGSVIGVLKDFNFQSLHEKQNPIVFALHNYDKMKRFMMVRVTPANIAKTMDYIKNTYAKFEPDQPIEINFLDEFLNNLYKKEERVGSIVIVFALIAVTLGCLGLFGLASFSAAKKRKEVGIRKVLGAEMPELIFNLVWDFIKLVILSVFIAFPLAYYVMGKWLENFAYNTGLSITSFLVGGVAAFVIAVATVSYHALKAATINPVDSIKYE